jgi:hypothetical protein
VEDEYNLQVELIALTLSRDKVIIRSAPFLKKDMVDNFVMFDTFKIFTDSE